MATKKGATKAQYWLAITYPENMLDDWQDQAEELLQIPFAYCIHDKDKLGHGGDRKTHVHWILVFKAPTTENHAQRAIDKLAKPGCKCSLPVEIPNDIVYSFNYLIHDTASAQKKKKHLYDEQERICGNNFDIGNYETVSQHQKDLMAQELCDFIIQHPEIQDPSTAYIQITRSFDMAVYFPVFKASNSIIRGLCLGNYQRHEREKSLAGERRCVLCGVPGCEKDDYFIGKDDSRIYYCTKHEELMAQIIEERIKAGEVF